MKEDSRRVHLMGRIIITGELETLTGLHIGGSPGALAIGNVDMPVIRNLINGQPYIPGSSLKGKLRSLSEKYTNAPQNTPIHKGREDGSGKVQIHTAQSAEEYRQYWVNPVFGVTGDAGEWTNAPNRLVVRDIALQKESAKDLREARTDMPYTEVKWEAAIDRVTSAATPRQVERVPAGAVFGPLELIFSLYQAEDVTLLGSFLTSLQFLEDDYLGGQGSRGSGKVVFRDLVIRLRSGAEYQAVEDARFAHRNLADLLSQKTELLDWVRNTIGL